jgi:GTP cyclohydrolase III
MARYIGPVTKIARKFRDQIFGPDPLVDRRPYGPGQHGAAAKRAKKSEYAVQLAEKQKEAMEALRKEMEEFSNQASKSFELAAAAAEIFGTKLKDASDGSDTSSQSLEGLASSLKKMGKAQDDAAKSAGFKKGPGGQDGQRNVYNQINKSSKDAKIGTLALAAATSYLGKALKAVTSIAGGLFDVFKSAISWITDSIMAVWDFFSGIYDGLFSMAKDQMQYLYDQQRAAEEIRENFGDITKSTGKAVLDFGKSLASASIAGLGAMQVFENAAEAIRFANEVASASPAAFDKLQDQFRGQRGNNVVAFAKGLGIATQELGQLMGVAISTGRTMEGLGTEITKYSKGLASRFGVDSKLISKSMTKAMLDVKHFANATVKEIGQAAVYAHKLGLELDKITGIMDAFDTFDTAAENVSKLSQAFGVNIDVMELISAKTPAEALNKVKQAFNAAGKSADQMNRQELKLLATTLNMDEATIKQALSAQNQGESLENIKDAGNSVEKQMMSTGEALKEVSQDIKRVVRELQITSQGFFSTFLDGFYEGIATSSEMRKVLNNMAQAIQAVFAAGRELGRAFVTAFPGVKKMLDALAQFFNPADLGGLFGSFTETFKKFFKELKNGTGDVKTLFHDLWENLKKFFNSKGQAGSEFLSGLKEFWGAVKQIIVTAITGLGDLIADAFNSIADVLENKDGIGTNIGNTLKGGMVKALDEASPIWDAMVKAFNKIKPAIMRLLEDAFNAVWDKLGTKFSESFGNIWKDYKWPIVLGGLALTLKGAFSEAAMAAVAIWAARDKGGDIGKQVGGEAAGALGNLGGSMLGGAGAGAALGFKIAGPVGAAWGAGAGAIVGAVGETVNQVTTLYSEMEDMQRSASKELNSISEDADSLVARFGKKASGSGGMTSLSFEDMSDSELLDQYAGLIGGRGWLTSDAEDAAAVKKILEEKYQNALKNQVDVKATITQKDKELQEKAKLEDDKEKIRQADEMFKKTSDAMGLTTIDNVEERIKKIKDVGAKIVGGKKEFEDSMNAIREALSSMNFSLWNDSTAEENFKLSLVGLTQISTFANTIKTVAVSLQDAGEVISKMGSAKDKSTIIGKFMNSFSDFAWGIKDISTIFVGGGDGVTTAKEPLKINPATIAAAENFAKSLTDFVAPIVSVKDSVMSLKSSINEISSATRDSFGGVQLSITSWVKDLDKLLDTTIAGFDDILIPKTEDLVAKIAEFNESIKEAFEGTFSKDVKVDVGEVGGEINVKNPSISMQFTPGINLQLKLNVSMDAKELEKIMVTRQDSIVVQAMNLTVSPTGGSVAGLPNQGILVTDPKKGGQLAR